MATARASANSSLAAEIKQGAEYDRAMYDVGRVVASTASRLAPRGDTGRTARSFVVVRENGVIRVGNTDPFFHLTEWGSANNPPYAPLRRGVLGAGLQLAAI